MSQPCQPPLTLWQGRQGRQGMFLGDRRCHPLRAASDVLRPSGKGMCPYRPETSAIAVWWLAVWVLVCAYVYVYLGRDDGGQG